MQSFFEDFEDNGDYSDSSLVLHCSRCGFFTPFQGKTNVLTNVGLVHLAFYLVDQLYGGYSVTMYRNSI